MINNPIIAKIDSAPVIIPPSASPAPPYWSGFCLARLRARKPVIIAASPKAGEIAMQTKLTNGIIKPRSIAKLTPPQAIDAIARVWLCPDLTAGG